MVNPNLNRYEIFLKVVESGNITRAAEALGYTQSGVSHAVAALEREAGFRLFIRASDGVTPTEDCLRILSPIQRLVNEQRNLSETLFDINNVVSGTLRIGTFTSVSAHLLPKLVKAFTGRYPLVDFELLGGSYEDIAEWTARGRVNCGFLTAPAEAGLAFTPLMEDEMLAVLPAGHPLTELESVPLDELAREPFILPAAGCDRDIRAALKEAGGPVKTKYTLNDDLSVVGMVENGFGVSLLPSLVLRGLSFSVELRPLSPAKRRTIGIVSLAEEGLSVVTRSFIGFLNGRKEFLSEEPRMGGGSVK